MKLQILSLGATLALIPVSLDQAETTAPQAVYVSPTGNDQNSGTEAYPFCTLEHARNWARFKNQTQTTNLVIYLKGGTYRLTQPLVLDGRDSGNNGYSVIYAAVAGGTGKAPLTRPVAPTADNSHAR